jgi:hypothetical protein
MSWQCPDHLLYKKPSLRDRVRDVLKETVRSIVWIAVLGAWLYVMSIL